MSTQAAESVGRIVLKSSHLIPSYRFVLNHLKHIQKDERKILIREFRDKFNILSTSVEPALCSTTVCQLWSRVSFLRMGLSKLKRPSIPEDLKELADSLGAAEGGGRFYITKEDGLITGQSEMMKKAKLYNMDLHPADIARHYELNERYHFNGKQRAHN